MSVCRSIALGFAVAVLLGGCQSDPEPNVEPTPSESIGKTSPSSEPEQQTAEEFIRAWVALDADMQQTGDSSAYLDATADCTPCIDLAERVEQVYAAGGEIQTQGWRVLSIREMRPNHTFRMVAISTPQVVIPEAGGKEQRYAGGKATYDISVKPAGDSWRVTDWYEVST